jgi:hypothetical protein
MEPWIAHQSDQTKDSYTIKAKLPGEELSCVGMEQ